MIRRITAIVVAAAAVAGAASASPAGTPGVTLVPPKTCGQDVTFKHADPAGVLQKLPPSARTMYSIWPYPVKATPWSTFKGKKGPWKIGYISFPIDNPWKVNFLDELKREFAQAKAKGLVTGTLQTYIQPSWTTATPEQQDAAIQEMVRSGVDGILIHPLNAIAETPAIDAAGKAGVPVVLTSDVAPSSSYAVNIWSQNNSPSFAGTLDLLQKRGAFGPGKTVNVLRVRGIPGVTVEQAFQDAATADMSVCKGIHVVGTVWGKWNPATTKEEVLKFLASHPERIDLVIQNGSMQAGIIQAFEQAGRSVPPIAWGGTSGGDLSWWLAHKSTYQSVGGQYSGAMVAYTTLRLLLRILDGRGLQVRDISLPPRMVTNANLAEMATPGKPVTWVGDVRGPVDGWASNQVLDRFFAKSGTPGGL
jgi:ribose transport system substrate-binding protein